MILSLTRRNLLGLFGLTTSAAFGFAPVARAGETSPAVRNDSPEPSVPYYVSALGNDNADGLAPETAWATIQKANASLPVGGARLYFRRGDTFYGELTPPFGCKVGAYGVGERPVLTMFKLLNRPEGWAEHSPGVWSIDLSLPNSHYGYAADRRANIGFLMVDGEVKPALKISPSELTAPWEFCCDIQQQRLYVAAPTNPTRLAGDIRAAPNGTIISCASGLNEIDGLHITGTGGLGIAGIGPDVHIHDCLIDYIGGSILRDGTNRRYGNGIENWVGVKRWLIERNEITQVYDVAWSAQGRAGLSGSWEDLTFRDNYIHDCTQSFEFWSTGADAAGGFKRILIDGNRCERAGYSTFANVRPDQDVRVHLLTYLWRTPADIVINDNIFDDSFGAYSYHAFEPVGLVTTNNTIRLKAETKMEFQRGETVERFAEWQAATGRELGSTVSVLP